MPGITDADSKQSGMQADSAATGRDGDSATSGMHGDSASIMFGGSYDGPGTYDSPGMYEGAPGDQDLDSRLVSSSLEGG